jgi:hypothetical protein
MGYPSALRYACAVAAAFGLSACNPPARQSDIENLQAQNDKLRRDVRLLQDDLLRLNSQLEAVKTFASASAKYTASLGTQVDNNARVANENALAQMTQRGACGTEAVPIFDTNNRQVGTSYRNKPCTRADLKP